ncbi:hypothetical protein BC834DRAFT_974269 [Gloeopeniophorella convolvens]|nr:hypothetical protein BC834DRAFT_974269 [Gloeopeniophorella convolvens]
MVQLSHVLVTLLAASAASAAPMQKRIAQTIADSTQLWVQACTKAGGADKCNTISQTAFSTLLAAGKNCDQQDAADQMVDLAKQLNNDPDMIRLAQIFVQQPRNAPDSLQVPYCQTAPQNQELNGFFHCQFAGSDFTKFSGDQTGNLPLGVTAVNPPGSCPAKNSPVPDGVQLDTLVTSPGTPQGSGASSAAAPSASDNSAAAPDDSADSADASDNSASAPDDSASASDDSADTSDGSTDAGDDSADTSGDASDDADAGDASDASPDDSSSSDSSSDAAPAASDNVEAAPTSSNSFLLENGKDAQALNAKFAGLTASSACQDGEQACVNGAFAQCVSGAFQATSCAAPTKCFALPLVNKAGTSVTCTTDADATARIAATGATGGITGA